MKNRLRSLLFFEDVELPEGRGYLDKDDIIKDLNLKVLFQAAAHPVWKEGDSVRQAEKEDIFVYDVMRRMLLLPLENREQVKYRQKLVDAAVGHPEMIQSLYDIGRAAGKLLEQNRQRARQQRQYGGELLAVFTLLKGLVSYVEEVKSILDNENFEEESGWTALRGRLNAVFHPEFAAHLHNVLEEMEGFCETGKICFSMGLGAGMKERDIHLLAIEGAGKKKKEKWFQKNNFYKKLFPSRTITLRTEEQLREAKELREAAFAFVLSWFRPFLKELSEFFGAFEMQLAFYKGCVNLWERGRSFGAYFSYPQVCMEGEKNIDFEELYELSMAILTRTVPVSNSVQQKDCWLLVITGANQGGKSTCLRSLGIAQIMMQCGLFVPAKRFCSGLYRNIYTHFTRREDATMSSGRLDEELKRMDRIVDTVTEDSLLLLNESFATTTEKEGSAIAMELVHSLYEYGIAVGMVTHLLQFAGELYEEKPAHALFLSAERKENGCRTYRMIRQKPDNTSFGLDLYTEIVENALQ